MFCEIYRAALSDAVFVERALTRDEEAHVRVCARCQEALAEERTLAASIDQGLRSLVNSDMPGSLLPRVRTKLGESRVRMSSWPVPGLAFVSVVLLFGLGLFSFRTLERRSAAPRDGEPTIAELSSNSATSETMQPAGSSMPGRKRKLDWRARTPLAIETRVIVSPDEEANLKKYVASLQSADAYHKQIDVKPETQGETRALYIAELELPRLTIEPLSRGESE